MHFWGVFTLSFHRVVCILVYEAVKLWQRAPDRSKWHRLVEAAICPAKDAPFFDDGKIRQDGLRNFSYRKNVGVPKFVVWY